METIPHPNPRFMAELPRMEPVVRDSTIEMRAKTCKRYYFYTTVLGYRERKNAIYLNWGIAYHKFREVLERTNGDVKAAIKVVIDTWQKEQGGDPPVGTKWDWMTLERLLASCKTAYQWWLREKEMKRVVVLPDFIEKQLTVLLKDGKTTIGAKVDQLTRWVGRLWGRDFKTSSKMGKYYERQLEPNDQFMRQTLIETRLTGEPVQGVLVEVLYNTKLQGPEIKGFTTTRSLDQLARWEDEQVYLAEELQRNRDSDVWPMEEKQCPFCAFRIVCKAATEKAMVAQLRANFDLKPWNFFHTSEDDDGPADDT